MLVLLLGGAGCARDEPVRSPNEPAPAAQPPIVDMSPSARTQHVSAAGARATVAGVRAPIADARAPVAAVHPRELIVPVAGVSASRLVASFDEARGGRVHEAIDIAAPRGTAVLSADDGRVLKLFNSRAGGLTVYAADPTGKFIYYYAHLDAYAPALADGQALTKGQTIGTVGTSGNADVNTPHLHFAILRTDDTSKWWVGTPVDPFPILRAAPAR